MKPWNKIEEKLISFGVILVNKGVQLDNVVHWVNFILKNRSYSSIRSKMYRVRKEGE